MKDKLPYPDENVHFAHKIRKANGLIANIPCGVLWCSVFQGKRHREFEFLYRDQLGRKTRPRTGVDAITVLGCMLGTGWFNRSIELFDTIGITNNPGVENCIYVFIL